jgi:hypothetical protein
LECLAEGKLGRFWSVVVCWCGVVVFVVVVVVVVVVGVAVAVVVVDVVVVFLRRVLRGGRLEYLAGRKGCAPCGLLLLMRLW